MVDPSIFPRKLLCAGVDAEARAVIAELLPEYGLTCVPNAFEAIRLVNAQSFDGYILECWLPDLSGSALCRDIRRVDAHAPIVFCSSSTREADRARALKAGASAYLSKPFDREALRAQLNAFLNLSLVRSLSARLEAERAIQNELRRQMTHVRMHNRAAIQLKASSEERMARARAYEAFVEARGTRAHFDSWWPQLFFRTRAVFKGRHSHEDA